MSRFRIATRVANPMLDVVTQGLSTGQLQQPAMLQFFTGPMPASVDDALTTQTKLGTLTFAEPAAPTASGRTLTFSPIADDTAADADGTAAWARAVNAQNVVAFDADVGDSTTNPLAVIVMNTVDFRQGGPIRIVSFTIALP